MKFAVVGPTYPFRGGVARHTTLLCRHLARRHDVHLVSFRPKYSGWLFHGLRGRDPSQKPLRPEGDGLRCEYVLDPLDVISWRCAARSIWAEPPDALILPWWTSIWAPAWAYLASYSHRQRTPVIYVCHDVIPYDPIPGKAHLARLALRRGDAFVAQSQDQAQALKQLLKQTDIPIRCLPLPPFFVEWAKALPSRQQARQILGLPETQPVLLFFGLVRPYKGLADLLRALAQVRMELPARLVVAGEFWEDASVYHRLVHDLGLEEAVVFHNRYIPDEDALPFFAAADVVVLPYHHVSQSGIVALAHGLGRPVIATRVGGLPEMIAEGRTGLLVPPGDPDALANAILRFYHEGLGPVFEAALANGGAPTRTGSWEVLVETIQGLVAATRVTAVA